MSKYVGRRLNPSLRPRPRRGRRRRMGGEGEDDQALERGKQKTPSLSITAGGLLIWYKPFVS